MSNPTLPPSDWPGLRTGIARTDRALMVFERLSLVIVCIVMMVMMLVVAGDALGRYFLNSPIGFTVELVIRYLLPTTLFLVLSEALRQGDHINVGVFMTLLPPRLGALLLGTAMAASAVIALIVTYLVGSLSAESWHRDIIAFGPYPWPKWVEEAIIALSWGLLFLRLVYAAVTNLAAALLGIEGIAMPMAAADHNLLEEGI